MTRVDPPSQWSVLLRSQLEQMARARSGRAPSAAPVQGPAPAAKGDTERASDQASTALRLRAIASEDPERRRKAFRIFMEATLREEFGHVLEGTGDFDALVDEVTTQMYGDPELRKACDLAADTLLAANGKP